MTSASSPSSAGSGSSKAALPPMYDPPDKVLEWLRAHIQDRDTLRHYVEQRIAGMAPPIDRDRVAPEDFIREVIQSDSLLADALRPVLNELARRWLAGPDYRRLAAVLQLLVFVGLERSDLLEQLLASAESYYQAAAHDENAFKCVQAVLTLSSNPMASSRPLDAIMTVASRLFEDERLMVPAALCLLSIGSLEAFGPNCRELERVFLNADDYEAELLARLVPCALKNRPLDARVLHAAEQKQLSSSLLAKLRCIAVPFQDDGSKRMLELLLLDR